MWSLLVSVAMAGTVYVNGVDVSALRNTTLENVTVHFDGEGNVQITAPHYEIQVVEPDAETGTTATRTPPPSPSPKPAGHGVAEGRWWLVTEDDGSRGHLIDVYVNGARALTIKSGEEQHIEDMGPWLRPGTNRITMRATSTDAAGGPLYVYVGTGSNDEGTLMMDTPAVQFGLGATRSGPYEREYTVEVAP